MGTALFGRCGCEFVDSRSMGTCELADVMINGHSSLCLWSCGLGGKWAQLAVHVVLRTRMSMCTARFARYACGLANSKVNGHSPLRSRCLWTCGLEDQCVQLSSLAVLVDLRIRGQWEQLASLAVLVGLKIQMSMGTARFVRCACGFAESKVTGYRFDSH